MWRSAIFIGLKFSIGMLFFTAIGIIVWENTIVRELGPSVYVFPDFLGGPRCWFEYLQDWISGRQVGIFIPGWSVTKLILFWFFFIASIVGLSAFFAVLPLFGKSLAPGAD